MLFILSFWGFHFTFGLHLETKMHAKSSISLFSVVIAIMIGLALPVFACKLLGNIKRIRLSPDGHFSASTKHVYGGLISYIRFERRNFWVIRFFVRCFRGFVVGALALLMPKSQPGLTQRARSSQCWNYFMCCSYTPDGRTKTIRKTK